MVRDVSEDARGILAPDAGLDRFRLSRYAPGPPVDRLVDRYWVVRWDLPAGECFEQRVWPHPVTNVVLEDGVAVAGGVATSVFTRRLEGAGRVFGIMFRPAGFRPLLGAPMRTITDRRMPFSEVAPGADALARAVASTDDETAVGLVDAFLSTLVPAQEHPAERTMRLAERAAADRGLVRVEQLADVAAVSVRTLQRRFADHVGITPKALIRRYRLFEAAEAARDTVVDWALLAARLGYSDQAHLTRDFKAAVGLPPASYARSTRANGTERPPG